MARPVIARLTDFGTRDAYVAAMKGVILGIAPDVTLVDLTHGIRLGPLDVPRLVATYAEVAAGDVCALFGSTDHLEVAVHGASAAAHFGAATGTAVAVRCRGAL